MAVRTRATESARTAPAARPVSISRWRITALLFVALLVVSRIVLQLGNVQVLQHESLSARARAEIDSTETLQPRRGIIRDSRGNVLALDVERESLFVMPNQIKEEDKAKLALVLSGLLGLPAPDILDKLEDKEHYWLSIKRWLEPDISSRIAALQDDYPGLHLVPEPRRFYPQNTFAADVIGAVNYQGDGISGVEAYYDTELKGITGTITMEKDQLGNPIWLDPPQYKPASDGEDLELTIDPMVQYIIETELKKAVEKNSATSGTIIVMDPKTGAIRGMASYPTFDPNKYDTYDPKLYTVNPAVSDVYEPGSTFKVCTISTGLQAHAFTADTQVNDPGTVVRDGIPLSNWNQGGNGLINPEKVLYYSSNVGALLLNEKTGPETFYKSVKAFGYGQPTGVDLGGESAGIVNTPDTPGWGQVVFDTNAYGQGISVTPLQQVRMMAAIGNDGKLMQPYVVQKRCKGTACQVTQPRQVGQPVGKDVAWTVRQMLIHSANHYAPLVWQPYTGSYADTWLVPGYKVSAKTGTSDIPDGKGGYKGTVIGSVLGLAPSDDARYAVLVKIDEPKDNAFGLVAAVPTFQSVVEQLLRYDHVPPDPGLVDPGQQIGLISQKEAQQQP
jgi:cell division protein FtsI (penicillin-binding protein 3)